MVYNTGDNLYGVAQLIVDATAGAGNYTTIASALTAAVSGQTIFIRPGTYTENLTLKVGVNLTAFGSDSSLNGTGDVIINGTCTLTTAGTVTISGIQLQTNSAALLAVTGSVASVVNLNNCYLNCSNNTGITYSSSNASSGVNIINCQGNLGTTGIAFFTSTSTGAILFENVYITNTGSSTTASTSSAGLILLRFTYFYFPLSVTSTGSVDTFSSIINTAGFNTTALTTAGTGISSFVNGTFTSGSASAISAGSGTAVNLYNCLYQSSNTNALTGAGTILSVGCNSYGGASSHLNNATTTTGSGAATGLTNGVAPAAGMIGEEITNSASAVSLSNITAKNVTSINLTAGIWDITGMADIVPGGVVSQYAVQLTSSSNTISGTTGVDYAIINGSFTGTQFTLTPVTLRATLSSTTTYYLVAFCAFSTSTVTANGKITATRVG